MTIRSTLESVMPTFLAQEDWASGFIRWLTAQLARGGFSGTRLNWEELRSRAGPQNYERLAALARAYDIGNDVTFTQETLDFLSGKNIATRPETRTWTKDTAGLWPALLGGTWPEGLAQSIAGFPLTGVTESGQPAGSTQMPSQDVGAQQLAQLAQWLGGVGAQIAGGIQLPTTDLTPFIEQPAGTQPLTPQELSLQGLPELPSLTSVTPSTAPETPLQMPLRDIGSAGMDVPITGPAGGGAVPTAPDVPTQLPTRDVGVGGPVAPPSAPVELPSIGVSSADLAAQAPSFTPLEQIWQMMYGPSAGPGLGAPQFNTPTGVSTVQPSLDVSPLPDAGPVGIPTPPVDPNITPLPTDTTPTRDVGPSESPSVPEVPAPTDIERAVGEEEKDDFKATIEALVSTWFQR